jgi:HSP20 family protein
MKPNESEIFPDWEEVTRMTVMRCRPMRDLFNIRNDMNLLSDGSCRNYSVMGGHLNTAGPDMDMKENESDICISVEIPGMEQNDMKITVRDNVLTLKGEKKRESSIEPTVYHIRERSYGNVERSFTLPSGVDASKISASYKNGVLSIMVPKAEEARTKEIAVMVT